MLALHVSPTTHGQQDESASCESRTTVAFVNGIRTTKRQAYLDALRLQMIMHGGVPNASSFDFAYFYNPTEGTIPDLIESVNQSLTLDARRDPRTVAKWIHGLTTIPVFAEDVVANQIAEQVAKEPPDALGEALRSDVEDLVQVQRRRVILAPHSQGNFIANDVFRLVTPSTHRYLGIAALANPDSRVGDSVSVTRALRYTTGQEDDVISKIRATKDAIGLDLPLIWNAMNGSRLDDPEHGHSFQRYYLVAGSDTRTKFLEGATTIAGSVPCPHPSNVNLYSQTTDSSGTIYLPRNSRYGIAIGTFATGNNTYPINGSTVQITVRETSSVCTAGSLYVTILRGADTTNGHDAVAVATLTPPYGNGEYRTYTESLVAVGAGHTHPYLDANETYYVNIHSQCSGGQADIRSDANGERFFGYIRVGDSLPSGTVPPPPSSTITIEVTGIVTEVTEQGGGMDRYFPVLPVVGDSYVFRYTFDPTVPDSVPNDLALGLYTNALTALSLRIGTNPAFAFATEPRPANRIEIGNGGRDYYNLHYSGPSLTPRFDIDLVSGLDEAGGTFMTDALPSGVPDFTLFGRGAVGLPLFRFQTDQLVDGAGVSDFFTGAVTSVAVVP